MVRQVRSRRRSASPLQRLISKKSFALSAVLAGVEIRAFFAARLWNVPSFICHARLPSPHFFNTCDQSFQRVYAYGSFT